MDIINNLNIATAGELAIAGIFVAAVTGAIKQSKIPNQYMPWISMGVGIIGGIVAVIATKDSNWFNGALSGMLVGAATSGLFDGVKGLFANKETKK